MATIRRLSDSEVRSIFESLHHNKPPPPHLKFQIVPVGPNGQRLSPPSYEFADGLYVLLKPQKKMKGPPDVSKVPPHLKYLIMPDIPPETCPWSLSGPQFPQPTAIQQRYCYPKGSQEYSCGKGGALWTMYGTDGKEDKEFRLLHVYFSAKRAANKGSKGTKRGTVSDDSYSPSPAAKRAKRSAREGARLATPRRAPRARKNQSITAAATRHPHLSSPAITASTAGSNSLCNSPGSVDTLAPVNYQFSCTNSPSSTDHDINRMLADNPMPPIGAHNFIFNDAECDDGFSSRGFYPVSNAYGLQQAESFSYPAFSHQARQGAGPYGRPPPHHHHHHPGGHAGGGPGGAHNTSRFHQTKYNDILCEHDLGSFYLNDPLVSLATKPSFDGLDTSTNMDTEHFSTHLDTLHNRIRSMIRDAPAGEQGAMVSTFASWAQTVAKQPLEPPMPPRSVASGSGTAKKTPAKLATQLAKVTLSTKKV